jgi:tetratricopeptide (TPR) repeat protein
LEAAQRSGIRWIEGRFLAFLALAALKRGQPGEATALLAESVALARSARDDWSLMIALVELGDVARSAGDNDRAAECYRESLSVRRHLGLFASWASLWHNLGYVALARGEEDEAVDCFLMAEREFRRWGDRRGVAECLIGLGAVAAARGEADLAARILAAGLAALKALGSAIWPTNQADFDLALARCRERMAPETLAAAWDAGRGLSPDAAWALVAPPAQAARSPGSSQKEAKTSPGLGSGSSV